MTKTNYKGVFKDKEGKYYYETELGTDRISGKRLRRKSRKNQYGKPFDSAKEAYIELTRVKNDYFTAHSYANYNMTYQQFMNDKYIPYYKTTVEIVLMKLNRIC